MRNKGSAKIIVAILTVVVIASAIVFGDFLSDFRSSKKSTHKQITQLTDPKVKQIFCYLQSNPDDVESCLQKAGPLTEYEINIAYQTAVDLYKYDLAVKLFEMGATDCYKEGQDILWIAINTGNLTLADTLLKKWGKIQLYHINAVRSLFNTDQPNWAYIYKKDDIDSKGYEKYQQQVQNLAEKIVAVYKEQNKQEDVVFPKECNTQDKYEILFGKNSHKEFEQLVLKTLEGKYSFDLAIHGSQKTSILVDHQGKKIGLVKSKNELLAQALDQDHFAGVPPVMVVYIKEKGDVILQKWLPDALMVTEYKHMPLKTFIESPNVLEELHHIRALDIRIGNSDRNRGNILVKKINNKFHVVPIDHDLAHHYIPNDINWDSLYLNMPFSKLTQQKISSINLQKDAEIMKNLGYNLDEIQAMKLRTTLLKMGSKENLSLKQIDMLFRFFYYDFLDEVKKLDAFSSEVDYQRALTPQFDKSSQIVKKTSEVWKLIGNNFEFYI